MTLKGPMNAMLPSSPSNTRKSDIQIRVNVFHTSESMRSGLARAHLRLELPKNKADKITFLQ